MAFIVTRINVGNYDMWKTMFDKAAAAGIPVTSNPPPGLEPAKTFGTKIAGKPALPRIDEETIEKLVSEGQKVGLLK